MMFNHINRLADTASGPLRLESDRSFLVDWWHCGIIGWSVENLTAYTDLLHVAIV